MKTRMYSNRMVTGAGLLALLLGGIFAVPALSAQPAVRNVDNRLLLVFDTSAEMKRRLPAVQKALDALLTNNMNGQLHSNDTVGVWTFDQELRAGQFPLLRWKPDNAALAASTINAFVGSQRYTKKTRFEALAPQLSQVVEHSERLTVVIFCDGDGELHGTPYDTGINQIFQQRREERLKAKLPIAIVLRSQLGEFVDCMVSFPPQPVSLPVFPPLPAPPPPPKAAPPPAPPRPTAPPLIIIGTPPTNRVMPPPPVLSNPPPVTVTSTPALSATREVKPPDDVSLTRTGVAPVQLKITPALLPQTNVISAPGEGPETGRKGMGTLGVILVVLAGGLVAFMLGRAWPAKKN
jgi:hypothetical protein